MNLNMPKVFSLIAICYGLISIYFKFDIITRYIDKGDSPIQQLFFPIILIIVGSYFLLRKSKTKQK
jgi:hypothetical protein